LYGQATKRPTFWDLSEWPSIGTGDPVPATNRTIELNYLGSVSDRVRVNVSFFRNDLDKLISRKNRINDLSLISSGKMYTNGVEASLCVEPVDNLRAELSASYQVSKDRQEGYEDIGLGLSPRLLGYFKGAYKFPKNISLAVTGRYIDEMAAEWLEPIGRLGETIDDYYVFDVNLRADNLFSAGLFASARVTNIFDQEIRYPTSGSNVWADKGYLGPGRSLAATVGWEF
jgi:outer membrane receptor for ferrienterochelin and colicin